MLIKAFSVIILFSFPNSFFTSEAKDSAWQPYLAVFQASIPSWFLERTDNLLYQLNLSYLYSRLVFYLSRQRAVGYNLTHLCFLVWKDIS